MPRRAPRTATTPTALKTLAARRAVRAAVWPERYSAKMGTMAEPRAPPATRLKIKSGMRKAAK
jgi:hypothetical protein